MSKNLNLQLDNEIVTKAETILEDIGLDCQIFFKMCLKKLVKENSISFLTTKNSLLATNETNETFTITQQNMEEENMNNTYGKNKITSTMRDCIWDIFRSQYTTYKKINYPYSEKLAVSKSGINQGSAHIYFLFLNNLLNGIPNTRIVKFNDLEVYLSYIREQFPQQYIENALMSLSNSIPYWEAHPTLCAYAKKVLILIKQYK